MLKEKKSEVPLLTLFLLALLGVPRVIAHDLRWVGSGDFVNLLLVFVPPIVWLIVVLWKGKEHVFKSLLLIGVIYGLYLGITHQILWTRAFDTPPVLGGNLKDVSPVVNGLITRTFGFISSLLTGTVIGLGLGLIGRFIHRFRV